MLLTFIVSIFNAFSVAIKKVAEKVPRANLLVIEASVSFSPCYDKREARSE